MRGIFNIVFRIVSSLLGLLLVCMGGVWVLQGLGIAFQVGFMAGDKQWVAWGVLLAMVGIGQVVWSNTRQVRS